jgi:DNA-directed RNA polymerase subunit beta'
MEGKRLAKGEVLCEWDPFNNLIYLRVCRNHQILKILKKVMTYRVESDDQTGYAEKGIIEVQKQKKDTCYQNSCARW